MPAKKKSTAKTSVKKPAKKLIKKKPGFTPVFNDHFDIMKMIYGSCGACPSSAMCSSADEAPTTPKKTKKK